ncbi:MAG: bifunctional (p)ppGpp synthetase/guanosine-3',5'-bis(diphosphate) 3'-pyrophosphohydrolase [Chloroflexi bacterium]|nr:bifunctional (p)ppGpp synthetase/guanosine-3',5'-bis(diphosphate) 3'-pyrophosphohydrolase [Chloroflexota bacterium]MYE45474.1 bifunctional (p)ppGpp synthetase/guanosine-3',5'-bis(diphosphate) 3'-pyrophosphohydrolase [Chloroflexota bacterium]
MTSDAPGKQRVASRGRQAGRQDGSAELFGALRDYLPEDRVEAAIEAYAFAAECHEGQTRKSGDPYIVHPVSVARHVAGLHMDVHTIQAALLHDVIEDCDVSARELGQRFGAEVVSMVEGATKIEHLPSAGVALGARKSAEDAETLRKMLVAMAEDVRVVIVKIADRLHNMQTIQFLDTERQQAIARETMDIYAPLASRLGIWQMKWQLEDLAFRVLEPEHYRRVATTLASRRTERERFLRRVERGLRESLEEAGIEADVTGRVKHLYSIHEKMQRYAAEGKSFDQIHDLLAVRVIVNSVAECYHALGVVHQTWHPIPNSFDDYIGNPKESMYQSLHTSVLGPGARPFEVQIRTGEMHEVAEYGVAAHWRYKENPSARDRQYEERMAWLRHLIEWQQEASGTEDFLDSVKTDVFRDQVFVFTPRGDVRVLPAGSTPIDFAYRIHTDLGHHCTGARVNGRLVALGTKLRNGDVIEIVRGRRDGGPSRDWLNPELGYLGSSHARQKVRQWFRRQKRGENVAKGRELLERERRRMGIEEVSDDLHREFHYESFEDMLAAIGYGDVSLQALGQKLADRLPDQPEITTRAPSVRRGPPNVRVLGSAGLHVTLARCCSPLPGDDIIGYITRSRGVTVHRRDCHNTRNGAEPQRFVECDWGREGELYAAAVEVHAWDRVGLLRDISTLVAAERVNMVAVRTEHEDRMTTIHLTLETEGRAQVSRLMSRLDSVRGVVSVARSEG